ncbi:MAG: alpha-amylase family glycosyl hydrolase [Nitrospirota bacterium]
MPGSLYEEKVKNTIHAARQSSTVEVKLPGTRKPVSVAKPFPSPVDWRDHWIYFLMIDRFNNPDASPKTAWDREAGGRQGGTFNGVKDKLGYLKDLGAGVVWLTPVLKNRQSPPDESHHGYGIMDFLEVDPRFGSSPKDAETEFINLVNEAHARGLYIILDIVINHAGDVFVYKDKDGNIKNEMDWSHEVCSINWRDENGDPNLSWQVLPPSNLLQPDAAIWPAELQNNDWFRRQGKGSGPIQGDFCTLKDFRTEFTDIYKDKPVWNLLIRAYQYVIAKFDLDGFRIDTLKHVEREFALTFCNAVREFAFSIGKKNFFIFGETKGDEKDLAAYTGRYTHEEEGRIGADASLDFPLMWRLSPAIKGFEPPTAVEDVFNFRKKVQEDNHLLSTHGEASRFFVTFIDNHDEHSRFLYPRDGGDYSHQLTLALGCIFSLQGIPCLYYGTEQGLKGTQEIYWSNFEGKPEHVREALWGKANAFDPDNPFYTEVKEMSRIRDAEPALRYGRQYFRQVSGNNSDFGFSKETGGIIAFSRILNDQEVIVAANTNTRFPFSGWVLIDSRINDDNTVFKIAYSNYRTAGSVKPSSGDVRFYDRNNYRSDGWARRILVDLQPMEIQFLAPE